MAVVTGRVFKFIPNPNLTQTVQTTITVYGNETGGSQTIPVTVTYVNLKGIKRYATNNRTRWKKSNIVYSIIFEWFGGSVQSEQLVNILNDYLQVGDKISL